MRSVMRSWSKWVIFSRRMKSSSSAGPRSPALSEFWLSAIGCPKFVVRARPPESTRTRSSGSLPGLRPRRAWVPTLGDVASSLSVLAVTSWLGGSAVAPGGGTRAASPYSLPLLSLNGKAAGRSCVSVILRAAGSALLRGGPLRGPLTVDFAGAAERLADGFCFLAERAGALLVAFVVFAVFEREAESALGERLFFVGMRHPPAAPEVQHRCPTMNVNESARVDLHPKLLPGDHPSLVDQGDRPLAGHELPGIVEAPAGEARVHRAVPLVDARGPAGLGVDDAGMRHPRAQRHDGQELGSLDADLHADARSEAGADLVRRRQERGRPIGADLTHRAPGGGGRGGAPPRGVGAD